MSRSARRARRMAIYSAPGSEPRTDTRFRRGRSSIYLHGFCAAIMGPAQIDECAFVVKSTRGGVERFDLEDVLARIPTGYLICEIERRLSRDSTAVFLDFLQSRGDPWGRVIAELTVLRSAARRPKKSES